VQAEEPALEGRNGGQRHSEDAALCLGSATPAKVSAPRDATSIAQSASETAAPPDRPPGRPPRAHGRSRPTLRGRGRWRAPRPGTRRSARRAAPGSARGGRPACPAGELLDAASARKGRQRPRPRRRRPASSPRAVDGPHHHVDGVHEARAVEGQLDPRRRPSGRTRQPSPQSGVARPSRAASGCVGARVRRRPGRAYGAARAGP